MNEDMTNAPSTSPLTTDKTPTFGNRIGRLAKRAAVPVVCIGVGVLASVLNARR